ncbi:MAG TPA: hypothetical protein VFN49_03750, partial [Candidatus Aquilonibacter sp.]|nr:hypothetical protein [Candidatus Aquilonibacter sp.]
TQQMIDQFSSDFGVPTSWDAVQGQIASVKGQASSALDNATGGYGSQIIGGLFGHKKSAPTPSPSPKSDTCSHQ